jgi:hypothetical protein
LTPASRRQDHTTSPSASVPFVSSTIGVHRIPPYVRDDRETPLRGTGWRDYRTDLGQVGRGIFLQMGLDRNSLICPVGQSGCPFPPVKQRRSPHLPIRRTIGSWSLSSQRWIPECQLGLRHHRSRIPRGPTSGFHKRDETLDHFVEQRGFFQIEDVAGLRKECEPSSGQMFFQK